MVDLTFLLNKANARRCHFLAVRYSLTILRKRPSLKTGS